MDLVTTAMLAAKRLKYKNLKHILTKSIQSLLVNNGYLVLGYKIAIKSGDSYLTRLAQDQRTWKPKCINKSII